MQNELISEKKKPKHFILLVIVAACIVLALGLYLFLKVRENQKHTHTGFAMSTVINQTAYGKNAQQAMAQADEMLLEYEKKLSMFSGELEGEIAKVNAAGTAGAQVSQQTAKLVISALKLSKKSQGAFSVTMGPLTKAWDIVGEAPKVLLEQDVRKLLQLVDDEAVEVKQVNGKWQIALKKEGMALDLGGVAKGAACFLVAEIYEKNKVKSALISIGGNVYVHGNKPDGKPFKVGFRNPEKDSDGYIASFTMSGKTVAVSGGYERFFEVDGKKYIHIINPKTGFPAESDIVSVGVVHKDGLAADLYSTTLFVLGREKTLVYMQDGLEVVFLDKNNKLYVTESLREGFELRDEVKGQYELIFVPKTGAKQ